MMMLQLAVAAVEYHPVVPDHDEDDDGDYDDDDDHDEEGNGDDDESGSPGMAYALFELCLNKLEILLNKHHWQS